MKQQTRNARIVRTEVQELKDILTRFPSYVPRVVPKHKHMDCRIWSMGPQPAHEYFLFFLFYTCIHTLRSLSKFLQLTRTAKIEMY
jgi:hypothetical protein